MDISIVVSIISIVLSVVVNIVAIAYFVGVMKSNQDHQKELINNLKDDVNKNFTRLEEKQDKHNGLIERMAIVEQATKSAHHRQDELTTRIENLEREHHDR